MQKTIESSVRSFIEKSEGKKIKIISHHDTDGITSAVILARALERLGKTFSIKILKQLELEFLDTLPKDELLIFLDLGSSNLEGISKFKDAFYQCRLPAAVGSYNCNNLSSSDF